MIRFQYIKSGLEDPISISIFSLLVIYIEYSILHRRNLRELRSYEEAKKLGCRFAFSGIMVALFNRGLIHVPAEFVNYWRRSLYLVNSK